jgi:hypothetical protein
MSGIRHGASAAVLLGMLLGCGLALADDKPRKDLPALDRNLPGSAPMAQPLPGYMQNMLWTPTNVGNLQPGQAPPVSYGCAGYAVPYSQGGGCAGAAFGYVSGYGYTAPMYGPSYGCAGGYAGSYGTVVVGHRHAKREARQLRRAVRGYPVATPY